MISERNKIEEYVNLIGNKDKKNYIFEIIDQLENGKDFIAYHGSCTDGSITAALLKYFEAEKIFIPLNYDVLKDKILRPFLIKQDWYAIVDLEPFNEKTLELFVDHHRSVIGSVINAKRIHFEVGSLGPSAAFVLYNSLVGLKSIPEYLKKLVDVSKVTDTASFAIDPPTELVSGVDLSFIDNFDRLCWFVQDATNIEDNFSLKMNNEIVTGLSKEGIIYLLSNKRIKAINKIREKRITAYEFIKSLEITTLMTIINTPDNAIKQYIALKLGKMGVKVIAFLSQKENVVTISLRQSKLNRPDEIEFFRLDLLAKLFSPTGGGGHAEAAGSISSSIEEAINVLKEWSREKKLDLSIVEYKK